MSKDTEKPTPETKALSLYLMAFKKKNPECRDKSRTIKRFWELVQLGEMSKKAYLEEVQNMLTSLGGYAEVVEKTVQFYINTTGEWKLVGEDKYCQDAKEVADKIMNLRKK